MQIQSVQNTLNGDTWQVILDNGIVYAVPQNPTNRHARQVQEWIDDGGVVAPYVSPPPPTQDEEIDRMGRIFIGFLKAYAQREGLTFAQVRNAIKAQL